MDIGGIQDAALFCLGAIAGHFHPDIAKLYIKYMRLSRSNKSDKALLEAQNKLKQRLRTFDLPPPEEVDPFVSSLREPVREYLDAEPISLNSLYQEEGYGLWENMSFEDEAADLSSDSEPPSSPKAVGEDVQNGNDQDTSAEQDGHAQDMNISSGAGTDMAQADPERPRRHRRFIKQPKSEGTLP